MIRIITAGSAQLPVFGNRVCGIPMTSASLCM